ncbi:pyridine nucleotide-disulfide oxidoreductase [Candidatus Bathyarchaeota archaeon]|nr:MAG: pyridine nucleotide-disulfide oxidoreductase [Candidatus Bathyarchaeota archaeon]
MDKKVDVLVLGGSAAGPVAALTARRYNKDASITVVRREKEVLVPCGIPYIFGTLKDVKKNLIPDGLLLNKNIEIIVDEAKAINRDEKTVFLSKGEKIGYKKLILATGSLPATPPIPGINLKNVFVVRKDVAYLGELLNVLEKVKDVVVIGGGFIGVEFADEFIKRGLNVTIVEILPHCLQLAYDEDFCTIAEKKLTERGVKLMTNNKVEEIQGNEKVEKVKLGSGETIKADLVLVGVGVVPNTELAKNAGLKIGEQRGIWVDEYMKTTDEDIFAVGDCAEKFSFFTGKPTALRLASIATREARIAGINVYGLKRKNVGVIGSFSTIIGDLGLGVAGLTEKSAKDLGFNFVVGMAVAPDKHPATMPGCKEMRVKLLFEKNSKTIIGGQVAGGLTTAEVTNILVSMIERKMTAEEVATFQFGSHPALTCSPITYQIVEAAEDALTKL